jgi:hypothetical protein
MEYMYNEAGDILPELRIFFTEDTKLELSFID